MLEAIKSLRLELDALSSTVNELSGPYVEPDDIAIRIQDWFFSWSTLKSALEATKTAPDAVRQLDESIAQLLRTTAARARKQTYLVAIADIRQRLTIDLLLAVAKLSPQIREIPRTPMKVLPEISDLPNELVPSSLLGFVGNMKAFLANNRFESNVFIMVAYRKRLNALMKAVEKCLRKELRLNPIIAKDYRLTDNLDNPVACLLCCKYGIAIFDRGEPGQQHNSNVVYKLAMMQTLKRPCVILKNENLKTMPSDLLHRLYEPYRTRDNAVARLKDWWKKVTSGNTPE